MRRWKGPAAWALLLLSAGTLHAAAPAEAAVQLTARDLRSIVELICTPIGAGGIDAVQARQLGSGAVHAEVRCQPHATDYSVPVARVSSCTGKAGRWECSAKTDVLRLTMPDESVLTVTATDLPLKAAAEAVREAAKLTIRPFYRPALRVMRESCAVARTSTSESKSAESFSIRCGETVIVLTKDCWNGGCRYFIPFAQNY